MVCIFAESKKVLGDLNRVKRIDKALAVKKLGSKDPAWGRPVSGLKCSLPSGGSLLESSHFGLEISDFGLKLIKLK